MPQLIAMVIVVVGAMIYMFQTFGGTGDKIEGIAQKTSIITEINNVRNGLQLAVRAGDISVTGQGAVAGVAADAVAGTPEIAAIPAGTTSLINLAALGYFADQMNTEIGDNTGQVVMSATADTTGNRDTYSAISFGGEDNSGMNLSMVVGAKDTRPGIRVQLLGNLSGNAAFLESQIATDLAAIASVDRVTTDGDAVTLDTNGDVQNTGSQTTGNEGDGIFTIYFKDMPATIVE